MLHAYGIVQLSRTASLCGAGGRLAADKLLSNQMNEWPKVRAQEGRLNVRSWVFSALKLPIRLRPKTDIRGARWTS
jgi:hypothetical protein